MNVKRSSRVAETEWYSAGQDTPAGSFSSHPYFGIGFNALEVGG